MRFFRLETMDGDGIYRSYRQQESYWSMCCTGIYDPHRHILPQEDHSLMDAIRDSEYLIPNLHFGFLNKDQYFDWVYNPEWRTAFHDHGVYLSEYEIPDECLFVGDTQVCFIKEKATLIERHSPLVYDEDCGDEYEVSQCVQKSDISRLMAKDSLMMLSVEKTLFTSSVEAIKGRPILGSQPSVEKFRPPETGMVRFLE